MGCKSCQPVPYTLAPGCQGHVELCGTSLTDNPSGFQLLWLSQQDTHTSVRPCPEQEDFLLVLSCPSRNRAGSRWNPNGLWGVLATGLGENGPSFLICCKCRANPFPKMHTLCSPRCLEPTPVYKSSKEVSCAQQTLEDKVQHGRPATAQPGCSSSLDS